MAGHVYGWDASDFDKSRGPMDLAAAYAAGIRFFTHKLTEGTSTKHTNAATALNRAKTAGIPYLGGYHVVRTGPSTASQVDYLLDYADQVIPWWEDHPGWFWQCDVELWGYDNVSAATGLDFARKLAYIQRKPVAIYASKGQYGSQFVNQGFALWNANYGTNPSANYISAVPADSSSRWAGWETVLQYGSKLKIGSQPSCDANVFKGSLSDFAQSIGIKMAGETLDHVGDMVGAIGGRLSGILAGLSTDPTDSDKPNFLTNKLNAIGSQAASTYTAVSTGNTTLSAVASNLSALRADFTAFSAASATPVATLTLSDTDRENIVADLKAALLPDIAAMLSGVKFTAELPQS